MQGLGRPQNGRINQRPFFALIIYKRRPVTMYHMLWQRLFREPVLLKRYVLLVAPELHGGFADSIRYGAPRLTSVSF
jgi:hypothetical protein